MDECSTSTPLQTVIALYDDQIDAEHALVALRKSARPASSVSVLARDQANRGSGGSPIDVTRAVMDTALSAMSGWLIGLAALMVPESGTVLAAGPIGVALARIRPAAAEETESQSVEEVTKEPVGSVGQVLELFGFPVDEAHYLEQRLAAGSAVIAVTSRDREEIEVTLRTFADFDAVFIGQAETGEDVLDETERWLANPMGTESAEVIIADVVVTLRSGRSNPDSLEAAFSWCGLDVLDIEGSRIGEVDDVLVDAADDLVLRYVIVLHGGVLGIAKRRTAIPATVAWKDESSIQIHGGEPKLAGAPMFDPHTPFSRKDELAVHEYFGIASYWSEQ